MEEFLHRDEVVVVNDAMVVGYDFIADCALVDVGGGPVRINHLMRMSWNQGGKDRFTNRQLKEIDKAVDHLVEMGVGRGWIRR